MTDRLTSEICERRQFYNRINELKISCDQLKQTRDKLLIKLRDLNEAADKLIAEKDVIDSQVRADPFGIRFLTSAHQNHDVPYEPAQFNSRLAKDDLSNFKIKFSSPSSRRYEQEAVAPLKGHPSDAFKMKISICLDEVMQKAEEIGDLSEQLSNNDTPRDEHRKQQRTH